MTARRFIADRDTQRARMAVCRACEFAVGPGTRKVFCGKCGCVLTAKIRGVNARCPAGKWPFSTGVKR